MPGNSTTTANPQTTWGSSATKYNKQYIPGNSTHFTITHVDTGKIDVYRKTRTITGYDLTPTYTNTQIGSIPQGGNFTGNAHTNADETSLFSSTIGKSKLQQQAKTVSTQVWDGKTQPAPNTVIYGENAINAAYGAKNNKGEVFAGTSPAEGGASIPPENVVGTGEVSPKELTLQKKIEQGKLGTGGVFDNASMAQKGSNTSLGAGEVVIYPQTLRSIGGGKGQDYIKLQMLKYSPKKFGEFTATNISGVGERKKNRQGLGSVILPIPGGISDNNNVAWGGDTMDPLAMAMASAAYATIIDGAKAGAEQAKEIFASARANAGAVKGALGAAIAGAASKTGATTIKRVSGSIVNPNMELLFNNPSLRQFNFSWKLAPRSREEAQAVIKIIRFFKQGMAPVREEPNLFLKAPNTWKITYTHLSEQHRYLNRFKECAMLNCGVQYTPEGNYSTYEDGVMTAYQLTLAFQELDPVYSDDYKDIPNTEIGF